MKTEYLIPPSDSEGTAPPIPAGAQRTFTGRYTAEVRIVTLREVAPPDFICDTPESTYRYWTRHVATGPDYRPDQEQFVVLMVNTRRRVLCHRVATIGSIDQVVVTPTETFRAAIVQSASAVILMHNHPSGDPSPSEADIRITRDMIRAGQLIKIEVLDHVVVGERTESRPKPYCSLREAGHFHA